MALKKNERAVRLLREMLDAGDWGWITVPEAMKIREEQGLPYLVSDVLRTAFKHLLEEGYVESTPTGYTRSDRPKFRYRKAAKDVLIAD
jgi:hypothetical protein